MSLAVDVPDPEDVVSPGRNFLKESPEAVLEIGVCGFYLVNVLLEFLDIDDFSF